MCLFLTGLKTIGRLIYRQNWCDSGCGWNWNAHKKKNKFRIFSRFFTHSPRHHHQANATYLFSEKRWTNRPSSKEYTHLHLLNSNFPAFLTHNAVSSLSTTIGLQCCKVALGKMNSPSFSRSLSARLLFFLYVFRTLALYFGALYSGKQQSCLYKKNALSTCLLYFVFYQISDI